MRALIATLALLAACGPRYIWVKNVGEDELNRDRYECERDMRAGALSFGGGIVGQLNANDFMGRCFQAKGYRLQAIGDPQTQTLAPHAPSDPNGIERAHCRHECYARDAGGECYTACTERYPFGR